MTQETMHSKNNLLEYALCKFENDLLGPQFLIGGVGKCVATPEKIIGNCLNNCLYIVTNIKNCFGLA